MDARNNDLHTQGRKDKTTLNNFRPITLLNIVYKIWAIVITNRLTPYMNLLTQETQSAYETGRSTIDILSLIQNQIQNTIVINQVT